MNFISCISLCAGVALFMFGMLLIKYALQENLKEKLRLVISKFTKNRVYSVFAGIIATVAMQSSSALTVLTASLADSGIILLYDAFWIIVGANVGTTFTGLLTAMNFSQTAPLFCVAGIIIFSFTSRPKTQSVGCILMGFGLIFVGMNMMRGAVNAFGSSQVFLNFLSSWRSPLSGLIVGALFTAVVQSSAAVTAVLQTLSADGLLGINEAYYIILGSNVGSCSTAIIASLGLKENAKRVALMHITFNLSGSFLFLIISPIFSLAEITARFFGAEIKTQIAFVNIIFNVLCALIVLCLPLKRQMFCPRETNTPRRSLISDKN